MQVEMVCSNRPRPATRVSGMGNQWWAREVYHLRNGDGRTQCGVDCREWLTIGPGDLSAMRDDRNCCKRCLARFAA